MWKPFRGRPYGLRFPSGYFRVTGGSAQKCGWSGLSPRGSARGAGVPSQSRCCPAGWPRNGRRKELAWPFRCTVRTSGLPIKADGVVVPIAMTTVYGILADPLEGLSADVRGLISDPPAWWDAGHVPDVPGILGLLQIGNFLEIHLVEERLQILGARKTRSFSLDDEALVHEHGELTMF